MNHSRGRFGAQAWFWGLAQTGTPSTGYVLDSVPPRAVLARLGACTTFMISTVRMASESWYLREDREVVPISDIERQRGSWWYLFLREMRSARLRAWLSWFLRWGQLLKVDTSVRRVRWYRDFWLEACLYKTDTSAWLGTFLTRYLLEHYCLEASFTGNLSTRYLLESIPPWFVTFLTRFLLDWYRRD